MKSFFFFLCCFFLIVFKQNAYAQTVSAKAEKCKVIKLGTTYTAEQIRAAVDAADWCGYIHKTKNYTLNFDDGSVVELLSYIAIEQKGIEANAACVQDETTSDNALYGIMTSGAISRQVPKNSHFKVYIK